MGSHLLLDLIRSGEKVRAIFRTEESLLRVKEVFSYYVSEEKMEELFKGIEWVKADVTDIPSLQKAFADVDRVYHSAAVISFDPSQDHLLRKVNIEGTANIVNFCIKNGIEKLCFVSSIATLDQVPGEKIINEESYWNKDKDHDMYAITKYGAEMEVWRASQEGVKVIIVNPGVIIGPGFWNNGSGKLFTKVAEGLKYYLSKITGFVDVLDVVKAMKELMNSGIQNEQFILVAENLPFRDVLETAAKSMKKIPPSTALRPWMISIGWLAEIVKSWFGSYERQLNKDSSKSLFRDHYYSSDKIKKTIGFSFGSVLEAVAETAKKYPEKS